MPSTAHDYLNLLINKKICLKNLVKDDISNYEIKDLKIIKDKFIINDQYKITCLLSFKKHHQPIILELHDNHTYFERSIFALKNLTEIKVNNSSLTAKLYSYNSQKKLLFREDINGKLFAKLLLRKKISKTLADKIVKKSALWLAQLHSRQTKNLPSPITTGLNLRLEEKILYKTLSFIKPDLNKYRTEIVKNLKKLIPLMKKEKKLCLIHGDYQPGNIIITARGFNILDFDTLELGNPGRDIGRFVGNLDHLLPKKESKKLEKTFLNEYYKFSPYTFEDLKNNILLHQAEMIQYIILHLIWGKKRPSPPKIRRLINQQTKILDKIKL